MSTYVDTSSIPPAFQLSCSNFGMLTTSFLTDLTQTVPVDGSLCFLPVQNPQSSSLTSIGASYGASSGASTMGSVMGYKEGKVSVNSDYYQLVRKSRQGVRTIYLPQFGPIKTVLTLTPPSVQPPILALLPSPSIDLFITVPSSSESPVLSLPHTSSITFTTLTSSCLFTASSDGSLRIYCLHAPPSAGGVIDNVERTYADLSRGIEVENKEPHYSEFNAGAEILTGQPQSFGPSPTSNGGVGLFWLGLSSKSCLLLQYSIKMGHSPGGGPTSTITPLYSVALTGVPSCISCSSSKVVFGSYDGSVSFNTLSPTNSITGTSELRYGLEAVSNLKICEDKYVASYGDGVIRCFKDGSRGVNLVAEMRGSTGAVDVLGGGEDGVTVCYEDGTMQEYGYEDLPSVTPGVPSLIEPEHEVEGDDFFRNVIRDATHSMELESEESMKEWVKDVKRNKGKKLEDLKKGRQVEEEDDESMDEDDDDEEDEEEDEEAFEQFLVAHEPNMSAERRESLKAERRASIKAEKKAQRKATPKKENKTKTTPVVSPTPRTTVPVPTPLPPSSTPHPLSAPTLQSTLYYQSDLPNSSALPFSPSAVVVSEESKIFAAKVSSNVDPKAKLYTNLISLTPPPPAISKPLPPQIRRSYVENSTLTTPSPSDLHPPNAEETVTSSVGPSAIKKGRKMIGKDTGRYGGKHWRRGVKAV
ncbi:hypothetical protein TrVE_jg13180 [Triparma verrucosa]|uniref:Uncharacterized protein n=1 Tax=Triparma verrucosa TaxID=1606542 RepID=A0A9W7BLW5_9STRA|nr:hypothetical protein TrVE_jg13180 [Triparma verrucosa]